MARQIGPTESVARNLLGSRILQLAGLLCDLGTEGQHVLIGLSYRLGLLGQRIAVPEGDEPLVEIDEPEHPLARRVAGLPPLPPRPTLLRTPAMAAMLDRVARAAEGRGVDPSRVEAVIARRTGVLADARPTPAATEGITFARLNDEARLQRWAESTGTAIAETWLDADEQLHARSSTGHEYLIGRGFPPPEFDDDPDPDDDPLDHTPPTHLQGTPEHLRSYGDRHLGPGTGC